MLPAEEPGTAEGRTAATNQTVRSVFIVGPDKKIKLMLTYPMTTGRNFDEVLRVLDSMQLTATHKVATPANWRQGEDVIIAPRCPTTTPRKCSRRDGAPRGPICASPSIPPEIRARANLGTGHEQPGSGLGRRLRRPGMNPRTLETKFADVYAIGDIANTGTPKAGVFAEGAAKAVAASLVARIRGEGEGVLYSGAGSCYIEFGGGRIGRVDVDFFSGPKPTGVSMSQAWPCARTRSGLAQVGRRVGSASDLVEEIRAPLRAPGRSRRRTAAGDRNRWRRR